MTKYDNLKLENQLCFPLYALSRLVNHEYQPFFEKMDITYPQYIVLMVLWEANTPISVNEISKRLILDTNTITPLLKRMESRNFITRTRSTEDERKVMVSLTAKGCELKDECLEMTCILSADMKDCPLSAEEITAMYTNLWKWIHYLQDKKQSIKKGE